MALSQEELLRIVDEQNSVDSRALAEANKWDHDQLIGVMNSLISKEMLVGTKREATILHTTPEGDDAIARGSPEFQVFNAIPAEGKTKDALIAALGKDLVNIGLQYCMKNKWVQLEKASGLLKPSSNTITDTVREELLNLQNLPAAQVALYKKRKLAQTSIQRSFTITKGEKFSRVVVKYTAELTMDMITSGSWKELNFKPLNLGPDVMGIPPNGGHLHTLWKCRSMMKEIFLEMGFQEMPTNNYVESSFWNFDTLFQPQQHPARDAHDTFFLSDPATSKLQDFPPEYLERVKVMHEKGGQGSIGWRYNWSEKEAAKNILRTHTTAVSSRLLYNLAQQETFTPVKYFSIDRVFRNESLDATHLAEFNQIEGLVADYNLTLGNLMGIIKEFFNKLGITNLQFKPAYNPYTEPSMEIFSWLGEGENGRWLEIGNSGIFRPEMLLPMGLPPNVRVIAWGLSLERPTMIKYKRKNIRSLFGHKVDVAGVQTNPICMRGL